MTTITQTITALPTAPARTDDPATFITRADAMMAALPTMVTEENTWAGQVNTVSAEMIVNAATATTQAGNASTSAGTATTQAGIATTQASNASASAASAAAIAGAFVGTSTSSLLIAIGSKSFTTQTAEQYTAGVFLSAVSAANTANFMFGQVTSYNSGTGALVLDVQVIGGSGTYGDWNISLVGARGATGAGITPEAVGFTATGGTTPKTLTVDDDLVTTQAARRNATNTFTATQTFTGTSATLAMILTDTAEIATVSATAATGTINYDVTTQSVLYYTTNASANWTVNFRASSGTSLNTAMTTGQSVTVAFLVTQGSTAYYNNVVQVDGSTVTPKYQGGTAYAAGNASSIDVYMYTIIKTGNAAFTVFTSQTKFA